MFPEAMNPLECLTGHGASSETGVWLTFWLCIVVTLQYLWIAVRWWRGFQHSWIAKSLVSIFLLCAASGYVTFCWSLFQPNMAYTVRVYMLIALCIANLSFLIASNGKTFRVSGANERLGEAFRDAVEHNDTAEIERLKRQVKTFQTEMDAFRSRIHG